MDEGKKKTTFSLKLFLRLLVKTILLAIAVILLLLTILILAIYAPISVICLLAGVLFEGKRIIGKWSTLFYTVIGSLVCSFLVLLLIKTESHDDFEAHVALMPYFFILFFSVFGIEFNKKKVIVQLTEGITLLQSVAITYWVIDLHVYETTSDFIKILMVIGLLFAFFTLFHAFTPVTLLRANRLALSIWSSIIMLIFASDSIYQLYQNEPIESSINLPSGFLVGLQFFLLGVSTIYIVQNFLMLMEFLPRREKFFNKQYFKELKELKNDHIRRYSAKPVSIFHSFLCVMITGGLFFLNYNYQALPRQFAIWIVFILFPYLMWFIDFIQIQSHKSA
jgi:hypothetical protein